MSTPRLVADIRPGSSSSKPHYLTEVGSTLFFVADDDSSGDELWKSDGTSTGTTRVADIFSGNSSSFPIDLDTYRPNLMAVGSTLFFSADDGSGDMELWALDVGDEDPTVITLAVTPASVTEDGSTNLIYTFSRSGPTTSALTVNYTVGGTATLGTDYVGIAATPATKTVTFAAGSATATVTVDPTADTNVEGDETVALTLAAGSGYTVGTTAAVVATIINNDDASAPTAFTPVYQRASDQEIIDYILLTIEDYRQTFKDANSYAIQAAFASYADNDTLYDYYRGKIVEEQAKATNYFNGLVELTSFALADVGIDDAASLQLSPWAINILLDYENNYSIGYGDNKDQENDELLGSDWSGFTVYYYDKIDKVRIADDVEIIGIDLAGGNDELIGGAGVEIVNAGSGDDFLLGMGGNDVFDGGEGNDYLAGLGGNDFLDGGSGVDVAAYLGNEDEYVYGFLENGTLQISDSVAERDGTDILVNIEFLRFEDNEVGVSGIPGKPNTAPIAINLSSSSFDENIAAGAAVATLSSTDPDIGDTFTFALVAGTGDSDNAAFSIDGNQLKIKESPDSESKSSYSIRLQTKDAGGLALERAVTLNVSNLNEVPTALNLSSISFNEKVAAGSVVATLSTDDPDAANTFSYSLVSGDGSSDNAAFSVTGDQLAIKAPPDFESKSSYSLRLRTTDQGGLSLERAVTLTVNDLNEAPTALTLSASSVNENVAAGSVVATLATADPDAANTFSYSLISGDGSSDNAAFSINGNKLSIKASPDFESKSSYSIRIRSTDQGGLSFERAVILTVNDLNEAPATTATITRISDNTGLIKGTVANGGRSDDRTPTITGTLSAPLAAGETLRLYNGKALLGTAKVNSTARSWSYTPRLPATSGRTYSFTARVADAAGNLGKASAARRFILDTSAPATTATITRVNDNTGLIKGNVANGGRSDDRTPTLTGTLSAPLAAGETLRLYNGKALLGTAKVNSTARSWSYTPRLPATSGRTYSFTARVADAAGNLGKASATRRFILDTTAPSALAFSPLDGAIAVELNANLSLRFSEAIRRGSGVIQLRTGSATGAIQERFDAATSTRLRISGDRLTVDPSRNLLPNTPYVLTIPAGAITDRAGNRFSGSTSYDLRTIHAITGNASSNVLPFSSTVDRLTGLGGRDTFSLASLSQALLPAAASTPIDRITDLASGIDRIDAPVARPTAQALNPVDLGAVADLSAASITALLAPENFPALSTTSTGGAASFSYADPQAGRRTFLAINNAAAGFSTATDAILEITGFSGNLNQLQVF